MSMIDVAHEHAVSVAISLSRCKKPNHRRNVYMIRSIFRLYISVSGPTRPRRETRDRSKDLSNALTALAPDIDPAGAELLSAAAHTTARSLAREYHVVLNPEFQAFLVNVGLRKRGWCGHWARDIGARLKELKTLVLHWGVAYDHTSSEGSWLIRRVQPKSILVRRAASGRAQAAGSFGRPRPGRYYVGNSYFYRFLL